jgi:tRNA-2-methylthio-N6-dimethylallyladenosine synthase
MNVHESEKIAGMLEKLGYFSCTEPTDADIIVFNTCCIRDTAEKRIQGNIGVLKSLKRKNKDLIIAVVGCMTQQRDAAELLKKKFPYIDIILGTSNIADLPKAIERRIEGKKSMALRDSTVDANTTLPVTRTSFPNAWVNIMYGCNNFCTYCIVPYVRGRERSRSMQDVVAEVRSLIAEGYKEITLLGQNVDSYGSDLKDGECFAALLEQIAQIEGKFRIRFMTSHPKDINSAVIDVMARYPNICDNIHLPVQSGSTKILKAMNRHYTRPRYLAIIDELRAKMPDIGITTDIMIGFPGETDRDFKNTLDLVRKVRFSNAFTFVYSPRKGTPAASMEQISPEVKKQRITKLVAEQNRITKEISDTYLDKVFEILVEDIAPKAEGCVCGRTESGRLVTFEGSGDLIGQFVNVKINKTQSASLFGEIVAE